MKGILLLNGQPHEGKIDTRGKTVYCCDGAYAWAKDNVRIDENVGDYDSLPYLPDPPPATIYPSEKNATDGEIALEKMIERGIDEIEIYGGGGKREDHFLGNLHLLYAAMKRGVKATLVNNASTIYLASGETELVALQGRTVSVLPFYGDALVTDSRGLKYPLKELWLEYGTCRGISNVVVSEEAGFTVKRGIVLVVINREIV
ncbi:MAG: thiamine diphosphokinase [Christensenellaceae bacterium]